MNPTTGAPTVRARSQRLLVTLLGSYWRVQDIHIPSTTLVRLLGEFDISPANARAALSRLTRRGLLRRTKAGRRTYYVLTPEALRLLDAGARRMFELGGRLPSWNGSWSVVLFSLGTDDRELRHLLHSRLRWLTFAPFYDGVWISPHRRTDDALELLAHLGLEDFVVLRTRSSQFGDASRARLAQTWDLTDLGARYAAYAQRYGSLLKRAEHGDVTPSEALVARAELTDDWRHFARDDPDLPAEFLPEDFPRDEARRVFITAYDLLAELARQRFDELVTPDGPLAHPDTPTQNK